MDRKADNARQPIQSVRGEEEPTFSPMVGEALYHSEVKAAPRNAVEYVSAQHRTAFLKVVGIGENTFSPMPDILIWVSFKSEIIQHITR